MTSPAQEHLTIPVTLGRPVFTVTLDSFRITQTRSTHEDTDHIAFAVQMKSAAGDVAPAQKMVQTLGDFNNGSFGLGFSFSDLHVESDQTLVFNYVMMNYGVSWGKDLSATGRTWATSMSNFLIGNGLYSGGTRYDYLTVPSGGCLLNVKAGDFSLFENPPELDCNGYVAAEQLTLKYADLVAHTNGGPYEVETPHPGMDSHWGCGPNSMYYVKWRITRKVTLPTHPITVPTKPTF